MNFVGVPGKSMQRAGHVLDLTFSNIPFALTVVRPDMHSGSDHKTQVTIIPGCGNVPREQFPYRVPEDKLPKFARLIQNGMAQLPDPWSLTDPDQINGFTNVLMEIFISTIQIAGKPDHREGCPTPWWTANCKTEYRAHLSAREPMGEGATEETREFYTTICNAKQEYWKHIINGVSDNKSLYRIIGWHKLTSNLKSPPLKVNGNMVKDTLEKAEALRTEVLERFSTDDDLGHDPLDNWNGSGTLDWRQSTSLEEVE